MYCYYFSICCKKKKNQRRRIWMKDWFHKRDHYSHVVLLKQICLTDASDFTNYFRMSEDRYYYLLRLVEPFLMRQDTHMRKSLPVNERLALTLRYLATDRSFEDLKFSAVMSPASISKAIIETCEVLIYVLQDYIKVSFCGEF